MPPKIVYGKKTAARPNSASYTKFLSPEKDTLFTKSRNSADDAGRASRTTEQKIQDELAALEEQLGGLAIDQKPADCEAVVQQKTPSRSRKALKDRDANTVSKKKTKSEKEAQKKDLKETVQPKDLRATPSTPPRTPVAQPKKKRTKPTTSKKSAQLPTPEPTPERDDIYTQYIAPLLPYSDSGRITTFEQWSSELEPLFEIIKIAEASFSEVYRLSAISAVTGLKEESVLKVVALKTPPNAPLPCQTSERAVRDRDGQMAKELEEREEKNFYKSEVADVLSEVKLLQNLNYIPGFTNFRDLTVLQGRPSSSFSNAWKAWNKARPRGKKSYFPDPSKKTSYEETQLWAVVEMQDAGMDCEKLMESEGLCTVWEIWDVFWGVCLSLAKAEEACRFEHRDLHMGNICVRSSRSANNVLNPTIKDPLRRRFKFTGLETTIIDYTLSRADIVPHNDRTPSPSANNIASPPHEVAYLDLNKDPALFTGDASEEYQYEIYRYMLGAALYKNPLQTSAPTPSNPSPPPTPRRSPRKNTHIRFGEIPETPTRGGSALPSHPAAAADNNNNDNDNDENIWRTHHPLTNLVWTHFLLHKLLTHLTNREPTSLSTTTTMKRVDLCIAADDANANIPAVALRVKKKASRLWDVLKIVEGLLCPVRLGREGALGSVRDLVVLAVGEGWLREGDVWR